MQQQCSTATTTRLAFQCEIMIFVGLAGVLQRIIVMAHRHTNPKRQRGNSLTVAARSHVGPFVRPAGAPRPFPAAEARAMSQCELSKITRLTATRRTFLRVGACRFCQECPERSACCGTGTPSSAEIVENGNVTASSTAGTSQFAKVFSRRQCFQQSPASRGETPEQTGRIPAVFVKDSKIL